MTVTISFRVVVIVLLIVAFIMGIVAAVLHGDAGTFKTTNSSQQAMLAFLVIGIITNAVALVLELLIKFVTPVKDRAISHILSLIFMVIAAVSYFISMIVLTTFYTGSNASNAHAGNMILVATVLSIEAVVLYIIQWKFG